MIYVDAGYNRIFITFKNRGFSVGWAEFSLTYMVVTLSLLSPSYQFMSCHIIIYPPCICTRICIDPSMSLNLPTDPSMSLHCNTNVSNQDIGTASVLFLLICHLHHLHRIGVSFCLVFVPLIFLHWVIMLTIHVRRELRHPTDDTKLQTSTEVKNGRIINNLSMRPIHRTEKMSLSGFLPLNNHKGKQDLITRIIDIMRRQIDDYI